MLSNNSIANYIAIINNTISFFLSSITYPYGSVNTDNTDKQVSLATYDNVVRRLSRSQQ